MEPTVTELFTNVCFCRDTALKLYLIPMQEHRMNCAVSVHSTAVEYFPRSINQEHQSQM